MVEMHSVLMFLFFAVSSFLILHPDYEDGIVGRLALGMGIAVPAITVLIVESMTDLQYVFNPETEWLLLGVLIFMLRHTAKFLKWRYTGSCSWKKPDDYCPYNPINPTRREQ